MKNQYFGDINDYRKYGLLRLLTNGGEIKVAVCWMLTADDDQGDGGRIKYLSQPQEWRRRDPTLYDHLERSVLQRRVRNVAEIENSSILLSCRFLSDIVPDDEQGRREYFRRLADVAHECDLVFFDPDNGIEVKSKPCGRKGSSKYLCWHEIEDFWEAGHSLLIYQHFPRLPRDPFIEGRARELIHKTGGPAVISFRTSHVVFFLVPQPECPGYFRDRSAEVVQRWADEIQVAYHCH